MQPNEYTISERGHDEYGNLRARITLRLEYETYDPPKQSVHHVAITNAITASITAEVERQNKGDHHWYGESWGQCQDIIRDHFPSARAQHVVELWERVHLNDMAAGCAHQGDTWSCLKCHTDNGWPVIHALYGEHAYPKRGDECHNCGRNRWDEGSDWCPESGYHYGSSWLFETIPADVLTDLRATFGVPKGMPTR